jgi:hypothetical protein
LQVWEVGWERWQTGYNEQEFVRFVEKVQVGIDRGVVAARKIAVR